MPELPEVETMVRGLRPKVSGQTITNIWADERKLIHHPSFLVFKKSLKGAKVMRVSRRGKVIVFNLKPKSFLLFHPKMTGHFLVFDKSQNNRTYLKKKSVHLVFQLSSGYYLAWSDQRKFSRIEYWPKNRENSISWLNSLGQEPLAKSFSFKIFNQLMSRRSTRAKIWLMDQRFIVGVGNIYASEILWSAKVDPDRKIKDLSLSERKRIYGEMRRTLKQAIINRGTSVAEFRDVNDKKGNHGSYLKAYGRKGEKCSRCHQLIARKITGSRSTYYCPHCQK